MSLSRILDIITRLASPMGEEAVPLLESLGRVVARPVASHRDVPPLDVSSLDGYAVKGPGRRFSVVGSLQPLGPAPAYLKEGEALFVPTGGCFPPGTRFVAREYASEEAEFISVKVGTDERKTVKKGEWLEKGRPLAAKGEIVAPALMGLLAQGGYGTIRVFVKPPVAVVTTGEELKNGAMADSNKFLLAGLVERDGGKVVGLHTTGDDEEEIMGAITASSEARLIVLTGGTARGKKDRTKEAARRLGFRLLIDSPPILPGKTMAFGGKGRVLLFILPGRPTAVRTLYDLFVRRALLRMSGRSLRDREHLLPLTGQVDKPARSVMVIPVLIGCERKAIVEVYPDEPNGFIVLEEGPERLGAGELVRVLET